MEWRDFVVALVFITFFVAMFGQVHALGYEFNQTFNDGLAPAGWSAGGTATWDFSSNYAKTTGNNNSGWYYKDYSLTETTFEFGAIIARASTAYVWLGSATGDADTGGYKGHFPAGNGYALLCAGDGTGGLIKSTDGGATDTTIIAMAACTATQDYNLRARRNSSNSWELWRDGVSQGTYDDSAAPITSLQYAQFYLDQGTSANKIDNFYDYNLFAEPNTNPFTFDITKPADGNYWSDTQKIWFNITDTNRALVSKLKLYYSKTAGAQTNLIVNDTNLLDGVGVICPATYVFASPTACYYSLDTTTITDGNYFIDGNLYNTDWNRTDSSDSFNIDNTDPTSVAYATQITNTTDANVAIYCTDANSGCKTITYRVNSGAWNYSSGTSSLFTQSGAGQYTLEYFSTDVADNNESVKTLDFNIYGFIHFVFTNEYSNATMTDVNVEYPTGTYDTAAPYDYNLQGITAGNTTFAFRRTDFGTRYYQADINQFSDITRGVLMLPDTNGYETEFTFYAPDQSTLLTNAYIDVRHVAKDYNYAGRLKTDASGVVSFFLNTADGNYTFHIVSGATAYDYNSVALTIYKPKDEETGLVIDANWNYLVSGVAIISDTNISEASQVLALYSNTTDAYYLKFTSNSTSPTYFSRTYTRQYTGNPVTDALQPYLVNTANGLLTTIRTISAYTNKPVPNIAIKVYTNVIGLGLVLTEDLLTDEKGEALGLFILNNVYEFRVYQNGTLLKTASITATSTTIWIKINDLNLSQGVLNSSGVGIEFFPIGGKLSANDTNLSQKIYVLDYNGGLSISSISYWITNRDVNGVKKNDVNILTGNIVQTGAITYNSFVVDTTNKTIGGARYDTNGVLNICVRVVSNKGTFTKCSTYSPIGTFDIMKVIGYDIRTAFGCSATTNPLIPCPTLLIFALFVSIVGTIGVAMEMGFGSMEGMGVIFVVFMGIFTYFAWVPPILYAIMVVSLLLIGLAMGGKKV